MEAMNARLNLSPLGKVKLGVHALQSILIFLAACIAIAMDAQSGRSDGRGIWFNVLVRIKRLTTVSSLQQLIRVAFAVLSFDPSLDIHCGGSVVAKVTKVGEHIRLSGS
jgi:hypothetical protein